MARLGQAVGIQALTVDSTAGGVAFSATPMALIGTRGKVTARLETAQIRWTIDGTAPTTTIGTLLEIGETLEVVGYDACLAFRAIRTGGTSGVLQCTFEYGQ